MAQSKSKESPTEPFKRALGLAVRAIAGDGEVQVNYAPGKPEIDGKLVQLPEPSRVPSAREVAVIRGWADSLALTAACHDAIESRAQLNAFLPASAAGAWPCTISNMCSSYVCTMSISIRRQLSRHDRTDV